jgi:hypothetical protein
MPAQCYGRWNMAPLWSQKSVVTISSPDYVVDDRFYPDQTNFIIANSRPHDGSTPEHRTPSRIHLPTATFYVCAKCDKKFNQFWDWAPICPHCAHGSYACVDGVTEVPVRQHTTILQERRVQTECFHRPLDNVLMATSDNFVSGTAAGPLSCASQWLLAAKVEALAYYEDMANAYGERRSSTAPSTVANDTTSS